MVPRKNNFTEKPKEARKNRTFTSSRSPFKDFLLFPIEYLAK